MPIIRAKCKICRRYGEKMYMKGERDLGQKCAHIRRGTPPGMHGKRRRRNISEYANELKEKQKLRYSYGLTNTGLRKVFREAVSAKGNTTETLMALLERRLDNAVYRAGFAVSRGVAKHMVSHGHIFVNARRVDIPSYRVRTGEVISVRPESAKSPLFGELGERLEKVNPPEWIELDRAQRSAKILRLPKPEELEAGRNARLVVEFYSK